MTTITWPLSEAGRGTGERESPGAAQPSSAKPLAVVAHGQSQLIALHQFMQRATGSQRVEKAPPGAGRAEAQVVGQVLVDPRNLQPGALAVQDQVVHRDAFLEFQEQGQPPRVGRLALWRSEAGKAAGFCPGEVRVCVVHGLGLGPVDTGEACRGQICPSAWPDGRRGRFWVGASALIAIP